MFTLADSFLTAFKNREDATQWVVLVVGVVAALYIIMRPKMRKRRDPLEHVHKPMGVSQQRQIERDMNSLMVQMLDTARQMAAQLDTRAGKLEVLLREADETLARLGGSAAAPARPLLAESPAPAQLPPAEPPPPADLGPDPSEQMPDPRHAEVYALLDQGLSAGEVARKLNRPNGEVELISALRPH